MLDLASAILQPSGPPSPLATISPHREPADLAHGDGAHNDWRLAALDEIDYGMVVVGRGGVILHCNYAAQLELRETHLLRVADRVLHASDSRNDAELQASMRNATERGLRKLLTFGHGAQRLEIALVPLKPAAEAGAGHALLMLGKRTTCQHLSIQAFASTRGLTAAETRVLVGLCNDEEPARIAGRLSVAISTVRTQIGSIRQKTGTPTIRALLQQIASLPPLMGSLRSVPPYAGRTSPM